MLFGLISDTDHPQETIVLHVENGAPVVVPDPALLFRAEFHRDGPDLLLLNEDGADVRVLGYFGQGAPAGLTTPEGAMLAPHVVERLTGPEAPGQYAQAGGAIAGNPIGQVETLEGVARVQRADGTVETLRVGMKVFQNDVVITEDGGTCSLTFADGTIFTLASGSRMLLDELIYDPNATEGNSGAFNLIEGSFVFIAGQVAKTGGMEVTTPAATMGIRGTTVLVDIQTVNGVTTVEVSLNVDPDGGIGTIELRDLNGNLIATIEDTDSAWIIEPPGGAEPIEIERTVDDLASDEEILADAAAAFALAVQRVDAGETFVELGSATAEDEVDPETGTPFDTGAGEDLDAGDTGGTPPPAGDGGTTPDDPVAPVPEDEVPAPDAAPDAAPVPDDASLDATEDTRLAGTLTATDADGDDLAYGLVTGAENGTVVVLQDGSFVYIPDPDFEGTDSFTFSVTDAAGNTATGTVTLEVAGVNDAPTFEEGTLDATQDGPATLDLATLVSDPDADDDPGDFDYALVTEGTAAEGGSFTLEGSVLTFTPGGGFDDLGAGETRTVTVGVSVTDGGGASTTGTVSVTVTGVNDAPVAGGDTATTDEDSALAGALLGNDTDVEEDALSVTSVTTDVDGEPTDHAAGSLIELASGATLTVNADGTYDFDPNGAFEGLGAGDEAQETFSYEISDGNGGTSTASVTITVTGVNDAPVAGDDAATTDEDSALAGALLGNDTDVEEDALSVTSVTTDVDGEPTDHAAGSLIELASGATLTVNADGTYDFDPNGAFEGLGAGDEAQETFSYEISDGNGGTSTASVTITVTGVNDAPVAGDDAATTDEDSALAGALLGNDTDAEEDALSVTSVTTDVDGEPTDHAAGSLIELASGATLTVNADGTYDFDPNGAFEGLGAGDEAQESFSYEISDGNGGTSTASVTITVTGVNDAPVAGDDTATTDEDSALAGALLGNDTDVEEDALSVTSVTTDVDGEPTDHAAGSLIELASGATLTVNADGTYDFDPNGAFEGLGAGDEAQETFSYEISDGNGGTSTASVTITVTGVNDAPVAGDDAATTDEDSALAGALLGNDTDVEEDALSVTSVTTDVDGEPTDHAAGSLIELASGATLTVNADGTYDFDPNGAFEGLGAGDEAQETFSYEISDGNGGTSTASVTITVTGVNDAPVAGDDAATTDEDSALAGALLGNDTDVEEDALSVTSVTTDVDGEPTDHAAGSLIELASGATLTVNADGTYDFDPNGAFEGLGAGDEAQETFSYEISDGNGGTSTASVTITVTGVNDAPVAGDDAATTDEDSALAGALLGNDTDAEEDALSVTSVTTDVDGEPTDHAAGSLIELASGATLTVNADGTYDFDPNGAFEGLGAGDEAQESFSYEISDGNGGTSTASVTITVTGVNDAPVAGDDTATTDEDSALAGALLGNDTDAEEDALSVTSVRVEVDGEPTDHAAGSLIELASGATLTVNADGTYDFDPNGAFEGLGAGDEAQESFSYEISDGNGGTSTASVTITVTGVNDAPVAGDDAATTDEDSALAGALLGNDTDAEEDALSVTSVTTDVDGEPTDHAAGSLIELASGATLTVNADGTYDFDPNGAFEGLGAGDEAQESFSYEISDGNGGTSTASVTITVTGVNDAPVAGDDTATTDEDSALAGALLGNDTDAEEDALSVTSVTTDVDGEPTDHAAGSLIELASGATLTVAADGTYDFDPNGAFEGLGAGDEAQESFSYEISDGNGGTSTASVTITITGVNDPVQVSTEDFAPVPEGDAGVLSNVVFDLNDVLTASDADAPDVPAIDPDSVQVAVAPGSDSTQVAFLVQGSTLTVDTANYDSLAAGESAVFEVTFDVVSGDERVAQSTTIEITGVNDDPAANDDTPATSEDTALIGNVLGNDTDVDASDALAVTGFSVSVDEVPQDFAPGDTATLNSGATLTLNADGSFAFDPGGAYEHLAPPETAQESFTYEISDGNGGTSEATVTITINGVNDAPEIADVTEEVNSGDTLDGTLTATDIDNAQGDLSFALVGSGTTGNGNVAVNPDGTYSYTPDEGFIGVDSFEVEVTDGDATSTATVTVEVGDDGSETPGAEGLTLDIATEATPDTPAGNVDIGLSGAGVTPINIVFALDASGSIGSSNWDVMLQNVADALDVLAEQFDGVEGADVQVSIIRFASDAVTVIEFTDLTYDPVTGESNLHDAVEAIPFTGGGTDWADTFAEAEAQFLTQNDGGIDYLYFVTDGNPTSSYQTELDSLTAAIDNLSIYTFAIGSNVDEANLIEIDSVLEPGDDVRSAATTADLTAAVQDTPLFNAALTEFSLSLTADGVDEGVVFSGVDGPVTQSEDGLSYDLPMAEIDGLEDVLGGQNDFVATAGFDIDGDGETDVTLVSTARIGKADVAQDIAGGDESDLLFGSDAGDTISAGSGNDMVFGYAGDDDIDVGTGDETVDAGAGDDKITVGETITGTGDAIAGGAGRDVLAFDFAGDLIDLGGGAHALSGIEAIDMANGEANTLTLDATFVQSLSDTPDTELEGLLGAALGDSLTVYGEAGDTLVLVSQGGFRESTTHAPVTDAEGNALVIYEMLDAGGDVLATLAVDEDVAVLPPAA